MGPAALVTAGLLKGAQAAAERIDGKTVTILSKVGTGTKLYGSVTADAGKAKTVSRFRPGRL